MIDLSSYPTPSTTVRPVPPAVAAGERNNQTPAPGIPVTNVSVEIAHRSDGIKVATFIDRRTGVVISQTPPEQVLAVVDAIVAAIQRREG